MSNTEIPMGWISTELGEILLSVIGGGTPSRKISTYFNGNISWFTVKDMKTLKPNDAEEHITERAIRDSATNLIPANTLIVATRISLGKAIRPTVACTINQDLKALIVGSGIDSNFLLYWVVANEQTIQGLGSGTTVKGIRLENLHSLKILLPPSAEQTRIVEKLEELLSDLDAGVAELKSAQKKLAQYRQSLLKSAMIGELTAEWRKKKGPLAPCGRGAGGEGETGAQLLARILKERRARWEEKQLAKFKEQGKTPPKGWQDKYPEPVQPDTTNLPELPEGWVWASLGLCFYVGVGATPSRKEPGYWNGDIPWVSSGEVQFSRISKSKESISEDGLKNSSTQVNPKGSVLLGMIGEGKTRGQVSILDIDAANNQNCAAIWVTETQIKPEFVYFWLWSQYDATRSGSSGNNQPALNKSLVEKIPMPLPPLDEIEIIVETLITALANISEQESAVHHSLTQAAAQRKNILKSAFSGQLVPQDPDDEPASVLLGRIQEERKTSNKTNKTTVKPRRKPSC